MMCRGLRPAISGLQRRANAVPPDPHAFDALKATVANSIRYSFLSDAEKAAELKSLAQRFAVFEARARELANGAPAKAR